MYKYLLSLIEYFSASRPINILEVGHEICSKNYHITRKVSPLFALEYIISGKNRYTLNEIDFVAGSGDIVLLPKNATHDYGFCGETCEKVWFTFDGVFAEQMVNHYLKNNSFKFTCPTLRRSFESIIELTKNKSNVPELLNDELSIKLYGILMRLHQTSSQSPSATIEERMMKFIDYNIAKPFSLDQIATEFGYSKNRLIVLFKEKFGTTPNKYYINKRIAIACLYLKTTDYTIKFISDNLGYADQHYFTNSFTSIMKITPTKYRDSCHTIGTALPSPINPD